MLQKSLSQSGYSLQCSLRPLRCKSAGDEAKLLLHDASLVVAMERDDLSIFETENIAGRDIYRLARGSQSPGGKSQITFVRSTNGELDNDNVSRDMDVKQLTVDIGERPYQTRDRLANGLPAKLHPGRHIPHVPFLREHGDKLLDIRSLPFCGGAEFSDYFFIIKHGHSLSS
ncbi:hypothetical protein EMIT0P294_130134 [Pseudomonas sp. IT-P294]